MDFPHENLLLVTNVSEKNFRNRNFELWHFCARGDSYFLNSTRDLVTLFHLGKSNTLVFSLPQMILSSDFHR